MQNVNEVVQMPEAEKENALEAASHGMPLAGQQRVRSCPSPPSHYARRHLVRHT